MKALRKDSGGYALLYVLIIVVVLCAIAAAICTVALRNYQEQARAVAQTRQLYQAEGEIEKFVALAEDVSGVDDSGACTSESSARNGAKSEYVDYVKSLSSGCTLDVDNTAPEGCVRVKLTYQNEAVKIETKIEMTLRYDDQSWKVNREDGTSETWYKAVVRSASHAYNFYTITHLTAERGEGHETE